MILMILGAASYTIGILAAGWYGGYVGLIGAITAAAGGAMIAMQIKTKEDADGKNGDAGYSKGRDDRKV